MKNNDAKHLCISLLRADTDTEILNVLRDAALWDVDECWRFYGDQEGNFSTIGSQQASPEAAVVEKVVNSVDARLIGACRRVGIDPEGPHAPPSSRGAVAQFFDDVGTGPGSGIVSEWTDVKRTEIAQGITLSATGNKPRDGYPCISIADIGEGQTPRMLPDTILSLPNKSNKLRIPFVQGRFNMGGTGALRFCGENNFQLVISRRDPTLLEELAHETDSLWSFTVVRRESKAGVRNSVYTYLAPVGASSSPRCGLPLTFSAESMPLLPDGNAAYTRECQWGTLLKLYEYQLPPGKRSHILMRDGLLRRLDVLLPGVALPVRLHECRKFKGKKGSFATNLSGITVRLEDDRADALEAEQGFPDSFSMRVAGEPLFGSIYAFKRGKAKQYLNGEGIIFVIHGQTHGRFTRDFFKRDSVRMSYLSDSLLMVVDCSDFSTRAREDLFMNSRDRLSVNPLRKKIEEGLAEYLKQHPGLRDLRNRRRQEDLQDKIGNDRSLAEALEDIFKHSPSLSSLFLDGVRIAAPFRTTEVDDEEVEFKGKRFPTFFKFKGVEYGEELSRDCHINLRCRISFETDAENEYLDRRVDPGTFTLRVANGHSGEEIYSDYSLNLRNGIATLSITLSASAEVDSTFRFVAELTDRTRPNPFRNPISLRVLSEATITGGSGGRRKASSKSKGKKREKESGLQLPHVVEVRKEDYARYDGFTEQTALKIKDSGEGGQGEEGTSTETIYDFFVNMDNVYLAQELKTTRVQPEVLRQQFKVALVLLGLSLIHAAKDSSRKSPDNEESPIDDQVSLFTAAVAPILLPMIRALGEIDATPNA